MRRMGIEALYRRPRTTKPEPGHEIYPYLLRGKEITRPNQVWAMDITYIPMARDFVYLVVVLDWASRRVRSWRVPITMEAAFRREAAARLGEARQAGNLQYRPRFAVHGRAAHPGTTQKLLWRQPMLPRDCADRRADLVALGNNLRPLLGRPLRRRHTGERRSQPAGRQNRRD
jgi:hypothetical protein